MDEENNILDLSKYSERKNFSQQSKNNLASPKSAPQKESLEDSDPISEKKTLSRRNAQPRARQEPIHAKGRENEKNFTQTNVPHRLARTTNSRARASTTNPLRLSANFKSGVKRIGKTRVILMLGVAVFFDFSQILLNIIPFIGNILAGLFGFVAFLTFLVWFMISGLSFMRFSRVASVVGAGIIEIIPLLNALPAWTASVLWNIAIAGKEVSKKPPPDQTHPQENTSQSARRAA